MDVNLGSKANVIRSNSDHFLRRVLSAVHEFLLVAKKRSDNKKTRTELLNNLCEYILSCPLIVSCFHYHRRFIVHYPRIKKNTLLIAIGAENFISRDSRVESTWIIFLRQNAAMKEISAVSHNIEYYMTLSVRWFAVNNSDRWLSHFFPNQT